MLRAASEAAAEHLEGGRGRAVITISDGRDEDEVEVGVQFTPELEERGGDEVAGTQAQLLALEILESAFGEAAGGEADHGHSHD